MKKKELRRILLSQEYQINAQAKVIKDHTYKERQLKEELGDSQNTCKCKQEIIDTKNCEIDRLKKELQKYILGTYCIISKNEQPLKKRKKRAISKKILDFKIVNPE